MSLQSLVLLTSQKHTLWPRSSSFLHDQSYFTPSQLGHNLSLSFTVDCLRSDSPTDLLHYWCCFQPLSTFSPPLPHPLSLCWNLLLIPLLFLALFHLSVSLPSLLQDESQFFCPILRVQRAQPACVYICLVCDRKERRQKCFFFSFCHHLFIQPLTLIRGTLKKKNTARLCVFRFAIQKWFRTNKSARIWLTHAVTRFSAGLQEFKATKPV